jgi:hypothetical protein
MALALEIDGMFDGDMDDAAVYTDSAGAETSVRAIVAPQSYGVEANNEHLSTVQAANVYIPAEDLTGVTVTLEVDTITVGADVFTVMTQPTNMGGVWVFACEKQEELSVSLRGRER